MGASYRKAMARPKPAQEILARARLVGAGGSVLVHALLAATLLVTTTPPPPLFELRVPVNVVLGLTDPTEASGPSLPTPADEPAGGGSGPGSGEGPMDAGVPRDAATTDAARGDGGTPSDAGVPGDAPRRRRRRDAGIDAGVDGGEALVAEGEGEGEGGEGEGRAVAFLPAGGQIALRVDLDRVRASPVREDVEGLLAALPDWQILLGATGTLEPVRDFSRVLIATPDFDRAHLVVAGRLSEEAGTPRELADRLAAGRGATLEWSDADGIARAPWSVDATPRTLAIVGPRHFVVSRDEDLPTVLANAAVRIEEGDELAADALLSLAEGEAVSLEVEGARHYVVPGTSPCVVPRSLRFGVRPRDEAGVDLLLVGRFAAQDEASEAARCLDEVIEGYARNPFVDALGFARPLEAIEVVADHASVRLTGDLTYGELRRILGLARGFFSGGRRRRTSPPPEAPPPPVEPPP